MEMPSDIWMGDSPQMRWIPPPFDMSGCHAFVKALLSIRVGPGSGRLPKEVVHLILRQVYLDEIEETRRRIDAQIKRYKDSTPHPGSFPPKGGSSPLMKISIELRKAIFSSSLPEKGIIIKPCCFESKSSHQAGKSHESTTTEDSAKEKRTKINKAADLMVLNRQICREVRNVIYEERTFEIHVHQGFKEGGIEFVNSGRQPLQYQDIPTDQRFDRFAIDETFGFSRLKKINIVIYPDTSSCRHAKVNTHFMILALCRLLDQGRGGNKRITSLSIEFAKPVTLSSTSGRRDIMTAENHWWDPMRLSPSQTSVHNLSDVELVLRPFAMLSGVHNVCVTLPAKLTTHLPSMTFVDKLVASMNGDVSLFHDEFEDRIEAARDALQDYIFATLFGKTGAELAAKHKHTEGELEKDTDDAYEIHNDYEDSNDFEEFEDDSMGEDETEFDLLET